MTERNSLMTIIALQAATIAILVVAVALLWWQIHTLSRSVTAGNGSAISAEQSLQNIEAGSTKVHCLLDAGNTASAPGL